jgi:uncharacterized protein
MSPLTDAILLLAAFTAGALNSIAGGGILITFPTMVFLGVAPVEANITCTVGLFFGYFSSAWAYRKDFSEFRGSQIIHWLLASLVGAVIGAEFLLKTPQSNFVFLLPYLLLFATLLFTFGPSLTEKIQNKKSAPFLLTAALLLSAVYGGYFGGGNGILILALFSMAGMKNLNSMNAVKTLLAGFMNGVAVVVFVLNYSLNWPMTFIVIAGAVSGGFLGAAFSKKVDPPTLRKYISAVGFALTIYFFIRR